MNRTIIDIHYKNTKKVLCGLLIILALFALSGCFGNAPQPTFTPVISQQPVYNTQSPPITIIPEIETSSPTNLPSIIPTAQPTQIVIITPTPTPAPTPFDLTPYACSGETELYNLYPIISRDGYFAVSADMYSEDTVAILYFSDDSRRYSISFFNYITGSFRVVADGDTKADVDNGNLLYGYSAQIISCNPYAFRISDSGRVIVYNNDFSSYKEFTNTDYHCNSYTLSKDGQSVFYYNNFAQTLYKINLNTLENLPVLSLDYRYRFAYLTGISSDDKYAMFSATDSYTTESISLLADTDSGAVIREFEPAAALTFSEGNYWYTYEDSVIDDEYNVDYTSIKLNNASAFSDATVNTYNIIYDNSYISEVSLIPAKNSFLCTYSGGLFSDFMFDTVSYVNLESKRSFSKCIDFNSNLPSGAVIDFEDSPSLSISKNNFIDKNEFVLIEMNTSAEMQALFIWDIDKSAESSPIDYSSTHTSIVGIEPYVEKDYGTLTEYANELERKHNVEILLGEDSLISLPDYRADVCTDESGMYECLKILDETLSEYPDGFFKTLCNDYLKGLVFAFTDTMYPTTSSGIASPSALTCILDDRRILMFNVSYAPSIKQNIFHEISHMIDRKLDFFAMNTEDIAWSTEVWNSLNPVGFSYYEAYVDEYGNGYDLVGSPDYTGYYASVKNVYFVDAYSKTFPTEDRARIMEHLLGFDYIPDYMYSPHMIAKMQYYFNAIRQLWDSENWTDKPMWEKRLEEITGEL